MCGHRLMLLTRQSIQELPDLARIMGPFLVALRLFILAALVHFLRVRGKPGSLEDAP